MNVTICITDLWSVSQMSECPLSIHLSGRMRTTERKRDAVSDEKGITENELIRAREPPS